MSRAEVSTAAEISES